MKIRLALSLNITRAPKPEPQGEPIFEHRDTDTMVESTYGGDTSLHRMGFYAPGAEPDDRVGMQPARLQYHPPVRTGFTARSEE